MTTLQELTYDQTCGVISDPEVNIIVLPLDELCAAIVSSEIRVRTKIAPLSSVSRFIMPGVG